MRSMVGAALGAVLMAAPVQAAVLPSTTSATVESINRAGFRDFAGSVPAGSYLMRSPFLTWYVHHFLSLHSADREARALIEHLRQSGVTLDATVHAAPGRSDYEDTLASYARADLGITTLWDLSPKLGDFAWTLDVAMRLHDDLVDGSKDNVYTWFVRAPFYSGDDVRAVRLDATSGARSLFVFWGTEPTLTALRNRLSPNLWRSIRDRFAVQDAVVGNFVLRRQNLITISPSADEGFGSYRYPMSPREATGTVEFQASLAEVEARLEIDLQGYPIPWPSDLRPPVTTSEVDFSYVPSERIVSAIVPMLYILQDSQTGAILLLGQNG
jgi:hypothetical protein